MNRTTIHADKAPAAIGPYSHGIAAGDFVFCSGTVGVDPATSKLVEGDIQAQTRQALTNLTAMLEAGGSDRAHVVKTTVFLTDMNHFKAMNEAYAEFFPSEPPARSTIGVKELPLGALIEIEAIAVKK